MNTEQMIQRAERFAAFWQSDQQNPELYLQALDVQLQAGRFAAMAEMLQAPPEALQASLELQHWLGMHEIATGQFQAAEVRFANLAKARPDLAGPQENWGLALAMQAKYAEAVVTLSAIAEDQLSLAGMHSLLRSYYWLGDLDAVIRRAVAWLQGLHPEDGQTAGVLALALVDVDQFDLAVPWAEYALQSGPNADALCALGAVYTTRQHVDQALACYQQAVDQDARSGRGWFGLAVCAMASGHLPEATPYIQQAMAHFANFTGTWLMSAWHALALNQLDQADVYLQKAQALDAESADILATQAMLAIVRGQMDKAETALQKADSIEANNPIAQQVELVYLQKTGNQAEFDRRLAALRENQAFNQSWSQVIGHALNNMK